MVELYQHPSEKSSEVALRWRGARRGRPASGCQSVGKRHRVDAVAGELDKEVLEVQTSSLQSDTNQKGRFSSLGEAAFVTWYL